MWFDIVSAAFILFDFVFPLPSFPLGCARITKRLEENVNTRMYGPSDPRTHENDLSAHRTTYRATGDAVVPKNERFPVLLNTWYQVPRQHLSDQEVDRKMSTPFKRNIFFSLLVFLPLCLGTCGHTVPVHRVVGNLWSVEATHGGSVSMCVFFTLNRTWYRLPVHIQHNLCPCRFLLPGEIAWYKLC